MTTKQYHPTKQRYLSNKGLVRRIWEFTGIPRDDVRDVIRTLSMVMSIELTHNTGVNLYGFGTFRLYHRKARVVKNTIKGQPRTFIHPEGDYVKFISSPVLKSFVHLHRKNPVKQTNEQHP